MQLSELQDFLEGFHGYIDFCRKLELLGRFLGSRGVKAAYWQPFFGDYLMVTALRDDDIADGGLAERLKAAIGCLDLVEQETMTFEGREYLVQPVRDSVRLFGVLAVTPASAPPPDLLAFLRIQMICFSRQAILYDNHVKKASQLATIRMLSEKVSGFYSLNDLLNIVVQYVTRALDGTGAVIRLVNRTANVLEIKAEFGLDGMSVRRHGIPIGDGVSGTVWQTREPRLVRPGTAESRHLLETELQVQSLICVPLVFEREVFGTISVYERLHGGMFDEDDKLFLEVISSMLAPIISYVHAYDEAKALNARVHKNLDDLTLITKLNQVIMTPRRLDELLYLLLTALTFGEEIGFNRAVLFMYNELTGTIQGMMGVGCQTPAEAEETWRFLPKQASPVHWLEQVDTSDPALFSAPFNIMVRKLRFDVAQVPAVEHALRTRRVYVQEGTGHDALQQTFGGGEYAAVPLHGKDKTLGVIYVDNRFTGKPIDEDLVGLLGAFASQAVLAIENAKLYGELRETNEKLRGARQEILMKEKLATVGEMLTMLAHEIRNPLTAIGGFGNVLARRLQDADMQDIARKITGQAAKIDSMFREFLYLVKASSGNRESVPVNDLVAACVNEFPADAYPRIAIRQRFGKANPPVSVDRNTIGVVLANLIKNAIEAMPDGGTVYVCTERRGDHAAIMVEDEGPGIGTDVLPHIFDPFYTTKFDGVGIGLSITYKIVKQHGGSIFAENRRQGGARFVVLLEIASRRADHEEENLSRR